MPKLSRGARATLATEKRHGMQKKDKITAQITIHRSAEGTVAVDVQLEKTRYG